MPKIRKVTVKHYLNTRGKPKIHDGKKYYPLYIQIIVAGHKAQLRSKIQEYLFPYLGYIKNDVTDKKQVSLLEDLYFTEDQYEKFLRQKVFPFSTILNDELRLATEVLNSWQPFSNKHFTLLHFASHFERYLRNIDEVLDYAIRQSYLAELNRIFRETSNSEEDRKLFKLTNYFIHFMNWDNPFCDFYEMTYEMLPSEIKYIENHLSDDLKIQIKALMAFHARENYLKRYMGKVEKGLIPTVHFIDWEEKGREFISKEFIKIFGRQKADEYIVTLDSILTRYIEPPLII